MFTKRMLQWSLLVLIAVLLIYHYFDGIHQARDMLIEQTLVVTGEPSLSVDLIRINKNTCIYIELAYCYSKHESSVFHVQAITCQILFKETMYFCCYTSCKHSADPSYSQSNCLLCCQKHCSTAHPEAVDRSLPLETILIYIAGRVIVFIVTALQN